jgi:hypothetical protein
VAVSLERLQLEALGPLDMILSKACRADDGDLDDIRYLVRREGLTREELESAFRRAIVPAVFAEVLPANRARILAVVGP